MTEKAFCLIYSKRSYLFGIGGSRAVEIAVQEGCSVFRTMLNSEPELDAASAAHANRMKIHAILPYEGQADRWPETLRAKYFDILPLCDKVEYISAHFTAGCVSKAEATVLGHCSLALFLNSDENDPLRQRAKTLGIAIKTYNQ